MQVNAGSQQYYVNETSVVSSTSKATNTQEDNNKNEVSNTVKTEGKKEAPYPIISAIDEQLEESFKKFKKEFSPEAATRMDVLFGSQENNTTSALNEV